MVHSVLLTFILLCTCSRFLGIITKKDVMVHMNSMGHEAKIPSVFH